MSQQDQLEIRIGETPNDGNGDKIRDAFNKVNQNFTYLFPAINEIQDILENIQTGTTDFESRLNALNAEIESINRRLTLLEKESLYFNNPMVLDSFYISDIDFLEYTLSDIKKTTLIREVGNVIDNNSSGLFLQWNLSGDKPQNISLVYETLTKRATISQLNPNSTESYFVPYFTGTSQFDSNTTFTLTAIDYPGGSERQIKDFKTVYLKFYDRLYWGASNANIDQITDAIVTTAVRDTLAVGYGTTLSDKAASAIDFDANTISSGAYLFFAYPNRNTEKFIINNVTVEGMMFTAHQTKQINIKNQYNETIQYNVIVFDNKLHGDNIEVTFT